MVAKDRCRYTLVQFLQLGYAKTRSEMGRFLPPESEEGWRRVVLADKQHAHVHDIRLGQTCPKQITRGFEEMIGIVSMEKVRGKET